MGYYIEVPEKKGKAKQIVDMYGGRILLDPPEFKKLKPDEALICVVDNGIFDAAGFAFDEAEFNVFVQPDGRRKVWVIMNRAKACALTGFSGR